MQVSQGRSTYAEAKSSTPPHLLCLSSTTLLTYLHSCWSSLEEPVLTAGHIRTPSPVIAPPGADVTPPDDPQLIPSQLATQSFDSLPPNPPPADATSDSAVTDVLEADNLAPTIFLDTTEDDNDITESISVLETVKKLTIEARKYKSFTSLFHLNSLKQFIELWERYKRNP